MAKAKKHKGMSGYFSTRAWTRVDVDSLFDDSKEFRKMAMRATQRLTGERTVSLDDARKTAVAMVGPSSAAGKITGKYPHPGAMLAWIAMANVGSPETIGSTQFDGVMAAIFAGHFRAPTRMAASWTKFLEQIRVEGGILPFFMRRKVNALPTRGAGAHMGLRCASLTIRIPVGAQLSPDGSVKPGGYIQKKINFLSAENESRFGKVFIGIASNGRSMWLASERGTGARASELLGSSGRPFGMGAGRVPGRFTTLYPGNNVKPKLPNWYRELAREKLSSSGERIGDTLT